MSLGPPRSLWLVFLDLVREDDKLSPLKDILGNFHPFCLEKLPETSWGTGRVRLLLRTSCMICGAPLFKRYEEIGDRDSVKQNVAPEPGTVWLQGPCPRSWPFLLIFFLSDLQKPLRLPCMKRMPCICCRGLPPYPAVLMTV